MCGILGYFGSDADIFSKKISLNSISHRGPDFSDYLLNDSSYLGHTRLSILDLSERGHQPMLSDDGDFGIIFNGEIYNHNELRSEFLSDVTFKSTTDTETLLYGIIKYGKEFINKLNGIFAFAFYHFKTSEFLIVRDQFGIKPLYYNLSDHGISFSSELKAIASSIEKMTINQSGLKNYLNFLWSPGEMTPIHEVKKLLPGSLITGNAKSIDTLVIERYYTIPFDDSLIENKSESSYIDLLESKLVKAVERQMMSDVPVGFFLSGGLDSSLIVAIAKKLFPESKIVCYTIRSDDFSKEGFVDDLFYAKKVAKYLDVELRIVHANSDILNNFDKVIYHLDEPQADSAPINVYNICREAKKDGIKVLLGGTAGDDLFSGYRRHILLNFENKIEALPRFLRKTIKRLVQLFNTNTPLLRRLNKAVANLDKDKSERMMGYFDWLDSETLDKLFINKTSFNVHDYFEQLNEFLPIETSDLNRMLYWELNTFLVDHNLNYTDKLGMATGVEVRVPFLDKELVEFSAKIPSELKLKGKETKYILKKVAERYLPEDVIYRKKTGFGAPVRDWIINDMSEMINDYLNEDRVNERGIFNYHTILELVEKNKKRKIDVSYTIWSLLAIESWMIQFYDKKK